MHPVRTASDFFTRFFAGMTTREGQPEIPNAIVLPSMDASWAGRDSENSCGGQ
jgi:hypothetical protein